MPDMTRDDYLYAGEVVTTNNNLAHIYCAGCLLFHPYPFLDHEGWVFEKYTVGWLCPSCHEKYKKGLCIAYKNKEYYYHLYCALSHGFIPLQYMNIAIKHLQQDRSALIYPSTPGDNAVGYYPQKLPDGTGMWCEACGLKLMYDPY